MELELKVDFIFSLDIFRSTFVHSTHLLVGGPLGMVLEHLQDLFDPKDSVSGFSQLFMVCFHVATRHIPESITRAFDAARLITFAKPFGGIWPITISEVLLDLVGLAI
jgi:hypothetical protein